MFLFDAILTVYNFSFAEREGSCKPKRKKPLNTVTRLVCVFNLCFTGLKVFYFQQHGLSTWKYPTRSYNFQFLKQIQADAHTTSLQNIKPHTLPTSQ